MPTTIGIPPADSLVDRQFVQIPGPDGTVKSFQYDVETNTMISRESQIVIPAFHGQTHVTTDPIPESTPFLRGLQSAEDKARLDALTQTRLGVLGFQGAGFPDDGGFMQGDIILAAGSEFISLERVGNVIRFTVDSPIPLSCNCEECAQIFWIQDESETRSVRPPSCNGIMPDISSYGELKIYAYPESTIFNPNRPQDFFDQKGSVPALIFKRNENGNDLNTATFDVMLKRRDDLTTNVGWSMAPGSNATPQCVWFMGSDSEGRQIRFDLMQEQEPDLLGAVLYNGATITRRNAVITGFESTVLETNLYKVKMWGVSDAEVLGEEFTAQNVWNYTNPENGDATPTTLTLDRTVQLLNVGDVIELYQFETSNVNGTRTFQSFFSKSPILDPANVWSYSSGVRFGDLLESRDELNHVIGVTGTGTEQHAAIYPVSDVRLFDQKEWGFTNFENNLLLPDDGDFNSTTATYEPSGVAINNNLIAKIDTGIPGVIVTETARDLRGDINNDGVVDDEDLAILMASINTSVGDTNYNADADLNGDGIIDVRDLSILATNMNVAAVGTSDRPIWLWDRQNHGNFLLKAQIGQPTAEQDSFPPIDIVVGGPIDHVTDLYMKIEERGIYETGPFSDMPFVKISGVEWDEIPTSGALRILVGVYRDITWKYSNKVFDGQNVILVGTDEIFPFDEDFILQFVGTGATEIVPTNVTDITAQELTAIPTNTVISQVLHSDYTVPAIRLVFSINRTTDQESVQLQVLAGTLSMSTSYGLDDPDDFTDDFVRGFLPGEFSISDAFIQTGFITDGIGASVESNPSEFRVYEGGFLPAPVGNSTEKWNDLLLMKRDNQLWVWWNEFLISPSAAASAELDVPVAVSTSYFPVSSLPVGKAGLRMWPGTVLRQVTISDQNEGFNEFVLGQLSINC